MFRIDRTLVKLTPMPVTTVVEAEEQSIGFVPEELFDASDDTQPEDGLPTEELQYSEPEPEPEPEPAGPTPEELAEERASEIIAKAEERVTEIIAKAEETAKGIVENAQRSAEELGRIAEEEAEQVREVARLSGYEAGEAEAKVTVEAAAKTELDAKIREDDELLRNVIDVIHSERKRMLHELESEVVKLTVAIAEKIIKLTVENDDKVFESMILNALRQMHLEGKITIRVGVREYDRFFSSGSAVFALGDGTTVTASVIKDAQLADGDLIIDSESGAINAGIDSQLRYIELALSGADSI